MAYAEKELEEQLMKAGNSLLTFPSALEELLSLLDQAEALLSRVGQSPSQSMSTALQPAMKALVAEEFLKHPNMDVKVAVASCISEITRITAPDAPYDDDVMKTIFHMIVEAFEKLDDISGRSYRKRVSILETVAKVRSCVVMLDLECDDLILEMFRHFLKTIRDKHTENVFFAMETIMTLVLDESEDISPELLSCLLLSVKRVNKDVLPIACRLGENVFTNCCKKLKPFLMEVVQSIGAPVTDFKKIVESICQGNSDGLENNDADDSKLSERTVSDELPQGSVKTEAEVVCPEELMLAADKSPKNGKTDTEVVFPEKIVSAADHSFRSLLSNGMAQIGNDGSPVEPTSPNKKTEHCRRGNKFKNTVGISRSEKDRGDSLAVMTDKASDYSNKNNRGGKVKSSSQSTHTSDKETFNAPNRRKGQTKDVDGSLSVGASNKDSETTTPLENDEKIEQQPFLGPENEIVSVASATSNDVSCPKRGQSSESKMSSKNGSVNSVADLLTPPSGAKGASVSEQAKDEAVPSKDIVSKKEPEGTSGSETKSSRHSRKKAHAENANDGKTPITDTPSKEELVETSGSEVELLRQTGKRTSTGEDDSLGKKGTSKTKQQKRIFTAEKNEAEEHSQKEIVSSPKSGGNAVRGWKLKNGLKAKSRKIAEVPYRALKLDETIIGSKILVWWPDDERFYKGIIDSFDPVSKKHTVLYADGDVEVLFLKDERWEFVEADTSADEDEPEDLPNSDTDKLPKKGKTTSDSAFKQTKTETTEISGDASAGRYRGGDPGDGNRHCADPATPIPGSKSKEKIGRKSKNGTQKTGRKTNDDTSKTAKKFKDDRPKVNGESKSDSPRSGSLSKEEITKTSSKSKEQAPKTGTKSKDDAFPTSINSKANTTKTGKSGRLTKGVTTPQTESKSDTNGTSMKRKFGERKAAESDTSAAKANTSSAKAQEDGDMSGNKRRRKRKA